MNNTHWTTNIDFCIFIWLPPDDIFSHGAAHIISKDINKTITLILQTAAHDSSNVLGLTTDDFMHHRTLFFSVLIIKPDVFYNCSIFLPPKNVHSDINVQPQTNIILKSLYEDTTVLYCILNSLYCIDKDRLYMCVLYSSHTFA